MAKLWWMIQMHLLYCTRTVCRHGIADEDFIEFRERTEVRDIFKQAGIEVSMMLSPEFVGVPNQHINTKHLKEREP